MFVDTTRSCDVWCLRCLLLMMYTHLFAKKALTLHLASSEGHERYFGCNLMHRNVLASFHQHLMAEAPTAFCLFPSEFSRSGSDWAARECLQWCLRYLLLVMCTHPCAKEALTLHLERSEGHQRYFGCNL